MKTMVEKLGLKFWQNLFLIFGIISAASLLVFAYLVTDPNSLATKSTSIIYICSSLIILFRFLSLDKYNPARVENKKIVLDTKKLIINILVSFLAFLLIVVLPLVMAYIRLV